MQWVGDVGVGDEEEFLHHHVARLSTTTTTQKQVPNHNEITYILTLQVPVLPLRTHHLLREKVKRCEDREEEGKDIHTFSGQCAA